MFANLYSAIITNMLILKLTLLFFCAGALSSKITYKLEDAEDHFNQFVQKYDRQYLSEQEKQVRFEFFKKNLEKINDQNRRNELAVFGITKFADFSKEEFLRYNGFRTDFVSMGSACQNLTDYSNLPKPAADVWDWRTKHAVTKVKKQGECGSCYAFSIIGNVEGQYAIKNKELISFSAQQVVDCDSYAHGCNGGDMMYASQGMINIGGVETEQDYPYLDGGDENDECMFDKTKVKTTIGACNSYHNISEDDLLKLVYHQGPLAIGIDATDLLYYDGGIVNECQDGSPNHGVLLAGYGTEKGVPFWIVKNSWDNDWGENGYVRLKRGIGACGLNIFEVVSVIL